MITAEFVRSIIARGGGTLLLDDGRVVSIDVRRGRFETTAYVNVCRTDAAHCTIESSLFLKVERAASAMTFGEFAENYLGAPPWQSSFLQSLIVIDDPWDEERDGPADPTSSR